MFQNLLKYSRVLIQFSKVSQLKFASKRSYFSSTSVGILGAPFRKGQPKYGVDLAPDVLRNYGLIEQLQDLGFDVKDFGNIKFDYMSDEKIKNWNGNGNNGNGNGNVCLKYPLEVGAACQKVSEGVKNVLVDGRKCVTLGGDHSLGIGTIHGHSLVHDVCVLWIDAHADINTPCTTLSGDMHGMPLAFLIEELDKYQTCTEGFEWLKPCIKKSNVAFIGLRDIDPFEKLILTKENILHFTMRDIDRFGIFDITKQALKGINPKGELSLHVSFDIDSIDTLITPSTGTPVYGGMTIREALCVAEEICHLDNFRAVDIVEVNPLLGSREQIENTIGVAALITKAFLGYSRQGTAPVNADIPVR